MLDLDAVKREFPQLADLLDSWISSGMADLRDVVAMDVHPDLGRVPSAIVVLTAAIGQQEGAANPLAGEDRRRLAYFAFLLGLWVGRPGMVALDPKLLIRP